MVCAKPAGRPNFQSVNLKEGVYLPFFVIRVPRAMSNGIEISMMKGITKKILVLISRVFNLFSNNAH